jgi:hypothetical protein
MGNAKQFWSRNLTGKDHLEDLGLEDKILLALIIIYVKVMDWVHLDQDRSQ